MLKSLKTQQFNCLTDYALETINSVNVDKFDRFFDRLPADPYLEGNYRCRRLSRFKVSSNSLVKLPHSYFFQSEAYNALLGEVVREYAEIDNELICLEDFQKIVLEVFDFCKLCSTFNEIGVHQIRIISSSEQSGLPAPEGIHRDGVDLVAIFCVKRSRIEGGETHLYKAKNDSPVFRKNLKPGELLVFNDRQFFHYTSASKPYLLRKESGMFLF